MASHPNKAHKLVRQHYNDETSIKNLLAGKTWDGKTGSTIGPRRSARMQRRLKEFS